MNSKRRKFLKQLGLGSLAIGTLFTSNCKSEKTPPNENISNNSHPKIEKPIVISTWEHGLAANKKAYEILLQNGKALDAVQQGVMVTESDPNSRSVGFGGRPDRDGNVTLDACIMDELSRCGSVAYLQNIKNPIAVARLVMDKTDHVMLAGKGALKFALKNGFNKENLLTPESEAEWKKWVKDNNYKLPINVENHDTIGMLALDKNGDLSGACTTSGAAWKLPGRVGDSPIIGAGLYVDNKVGAACATGQGELVIQVCGSFLVVEMMRQGKSPEESCRIATQRIVDIHPKNEGLQVGFIALTNKGEHGGFCMRPGFDYAVHIKDSNEMYKTNHLLEW